MNTAKKVDKNLPVWRRKHRMSYGLGAGKEGYEYRRAAKRPEGTGWELHPDAKSNKKAMTKARIFT